MRKEAAVDALRQTQMQLQRNQFDAEKKVAVADTSIQNLQRTIAQIEEEQKQRQKSVKKLEDRKEAKRRRT